MTHLHLDISFNDTMSHQKTTFQEKMLSYVSKQYFFCTACLSFVMLLVYFHISEFKVKIQFSLNFYFLIWVNHDLLQCASFKSCMRMGVERKTTFYNPLSWSCCFPFLKETDGRGLNLSLVLFTCSTFYGIKHYLHSYN